MKFEAEPIHQIRVGTRRLRAVLRIFSDMMDEQWATELEGELRWLAHLLGSVRDLDVLRKRLRSETKPRDKSALNYVQRILAKRHREAQAAMREGLKSERYHALRERLHAGTLSPQVSIESGEPALEVLLPMLRDSWKRLAKAARKINSLDKPTRYHKIRKSGKRVRYATEMLEADLPEKRAGDAEKFVKRMKELQDTLGELQDSVVAAQTLEQLFELGTAHGSGIRNIIKVEQHSEEKARKKFFKIWSKIDRTKHQNWMTIGSSS